MQISRSKGGVADPGAMAVVSMAGLKRSAAACAGSVRDWFLQRPHWSAPAGCGVVSAADRGFFPGLQLLVCSLRGRCPVVVFDLGLSAGQLAWLKKEGVGVEWLGESEYLVPKSITMWQTWNKPAFLAWCGIEFPLWIDADALVVGDLTPLFRVVMHRPLLCAHEAPEVYRCLNGDGLYERLPVRSRWSSRECVQAGVVGLCPGRDEALLAKWSEGCSYAAGGELGSLFQCWDQGALTWAAEDMELAHCLCHSVGWNRLVMGWSVAGSGGPAGVLSRLTVGADDRVLHLTSVPKYFSKWGSDVFLE